MESRILTEPVLVGREKELEELQHYLSLAMKGKGNTVFISGEAGVGKTRLLKEFLKVAKQKRVTVLTGWCLGNAAVPYFPFVEAFDSYSSTNEDETATIKQKIGLKSWLKETNQSEANQTLAALMPQVWKDQTFAAVIKELLFLSGKKPLILALEDIQWADSASLSLLHYLARQVSSDRILILATFRSEELEANNESHPSPLYSVLLLMGREELYKEVKLPNLSANNVKKIAQSMLGGNAHPELVERMAIESGGNPLFVVEAIRMLHQQGSLFKKNGQWNLCTDDFGIPRKVKDVILLRLEALMPNQRKILDVASVVGEKFDPELVADVISQESTDVLRELNHISKTTLMVNCDGNFCMFTHVKFREMLYKEMPLLLRRKYHSRIAERIETSKNVDEALVNDLAFHYVQGGNKAKALEYALQAGKFALSKFSNAQAIKHFMFVLEAVREDSKRFEERTSALEGLGDAFYSSSMFKESMRAFEDLADAAERGDMKLRALRKTMESAFQLGNVSHLMELVKRSEPYISASRLERARVLFSRGRAFVMKNMMPEGTKDIEAALHIFEEEYSLSDIALTLIALGPGHSAIGMRHEGITESLRSIALFEELDDFRWQMEANWVAAVAFRLCRLNPEADERLYDIIEMEEKLKTGDVLRPVIANALLCFSPLIIGDFKKALSFALKALELSRKTDSTVSHGLTFSFLTCIYSFVGDFERAKCYFDKLMKLPSEIFAHPLVNVSLTKAVFYAGESRWNDSEQYFRECFESTKVLPTFWDQIVELSYVWALERQGRFEEARVQREKSDKIRRDAEEMFEHAIIKANLVAPSNVRVGQSFEARLEIVNASRVTSALVRVQELSSPRLNGPSCSKGSCLLNRTVEAETKKLKPFEVRTVKFSFQARQEGNTVLAPVIFYVDDLKKTATCRANTVCVTIGPTEPSISEGGSYHFPEIEFKSEAAEKAYNFLVHAFEEDNVRQRLPLDKCGWRTLMEVAKNAQVTTYSMYGRYGRGATAMSELDRLGLIESRSYHGERGRGGRILKIRVLNKNLRNSSRTTTGQETNCKDSFT